jgi:hypothetical protein
LQEHVKNLEGDEEDDEEEGGGCEVRFLGDLCDEWADVGFGEEGVAEDLAEVWGEGEGVVAEEEGRPVCEKDELDVLIVLETGFEDTLYGVHDGWLWSF